MNNTSEMNSIYLLLNAIIIPLKKNYTIIGGGRGIAIPKNTDGFIIHFDVKMYSNS